MNADTTKKFLDVVRGVVDDYDSSADQTAVCIIASANDDGTYNIRLLSDEGTIVPNIVNGSPYAYRIGDMAYLYKVRNSMASSFLIGGTKAAIASGGSALSSGSSPSSAASSGSGAASAKTYVSVAGYSDSPLLSIVIDGVQNNITINHVDAANYASEAGNAATAAVADNYSSSGTIASALASKQDTLVWDNQPTAGSANPVRSGGLFNYAVSDVSWDEAYAHLSVTKGSSTACIASSQPEAQANASYSIADSTDGINADAHSSIPTGAAVYNFASTAAKIHVYPTGGVYPIVGANPVSGDSGASVLYANASSPTVNTQTGEINASSIASGTVTASVGCFSGLSVTGSATIANLVTTGTTTFINATNVNITDQLIVIGANNTQALLTPAGIVVNDYDGKGNYGGILYDANGYAYVGDVVLNADGTVNAAASDLQKLATRADALTDNYISVWNGSTQEYEDGIDIHNVLNMATATNVPVGQANISYSIVTNIESNQTDSALPTAAAVANYAASARHFSIALSPDGTYNTTAGFASATYLVSTGVGYVNGNFIAQADISRGNMAAVSSATDLSAWLGTSTGNFVGVGSDMTFDNDMSFKLVVVNGVGTLYSSAVQSGHVVRFKIYC